MSTGDLLQLIHQIEKVGVLRALIFLRDGSKTTNEFEEIMALPTWTRTARPILLELGLIEVTKGEKRRVIHSLTDKGEKVTDSVVKLLEVLLHD